MSLKRHVLYVQCSVLASVLYPKQILQLGLDASVTVYQSLRENVVWHVVDILRGKQNTGNKSLWPPGLEHTWLKMIFFWVGGGGLDAMAFQHF